jgi:hypothetical protein
MPEDALLTGIFNDFVVCGEALREALETCGRGARSVSSPVRGKSTSVRLELSADFPRTDEDAHL